MVHGSPAGQKGSCCWGLQVSPSGIYCWAIPLTPDGWIPCWLERIQWLGAASITIRYLLLSYPFISRRSMDPLLNAKDPVAGGWIYPHKVSGWAFSLTPGPGCAIPLNTAFRTCPVKTCCISKLGQLAQYISFQRSRLQNPIASQNLSANCFQLLMRDV
jgi:hypothetical protein